ncbi:MAG: sigma-70 family RNA polymerase sigma factor [Actinomycetota bacterium]|nr:sigma-70 family RNA polymerase sigma factor [Actinomycetota bacterium]MDZ4178434.1 sigma-70 family RNA polymerase sigma factor [Coriobacteriia bacterium]
MSAFDEERIDKLVSGAVGGDTEAFGALFDIYADRVFAFVRSRVENRHDAEDITETVFLKAFEAIPSYRRKGPPFGAWLFRIARNAVVDHVRRSGRSPQLAEDLGDLVGADPLQTHEKVFAKIEAEQLGVLVRRLTQEQSEVIACRFYWDMDVRETARSLGRTEGSVKALQHRALRSLARLLEEQEIDEA